MTTWENWFTGEMKAIAGVKELMMTDDGTNLKEISPCEKALIKRYGELTNLSHDERIRYAQAGFSDCWKAYVAPLKECVEYYAGQRSTIDDLYLGHEIAKECLEKLE